jgi:membrane protein implicated in regulation of membrane protease activity
MSNYVEWWDGLSLSLKIFWIAAVPFTAFFATQLLINIFGHDSHHDAHGHDAGFDDGSVPFHFLTFKNVVAFFSIFGWVGIAAIDSGVTIWMAYLLATAGGIGMMLIMATIFYILAKANVDGTMKFKNAVGVSGEVYLTIPANRGSVGMVQVKIQNSLRTLEAITDDESDIPTGKIIKVMKVVNNNLLVVTAE